MPIQLLAMHVQECETGICIDSSDCESLLFNLSQDPEVPPISTKVNQSSVNNTKDPDTEVPSTSTKLDTFSSNFKDELDTVNSFVSVMDPMVSCPVCSGMYSQDYIEVHASTCGERCENRPNMDLDITVQNPDKQSSITEVIHKLKEAIDPTTIFSVCVTRKDMFNRGLMQWKRQKKSSPKNPLRVTFIGEPGIDSGALMKEFLTEMMAGIEAKFFEGGNSGKNLKYSTTDFQNDNYRTIGEIMAVSITQDGPPPNFFQEWIYNFISSGDIDKDQLSKATVTDADLLDLIEKIETADATALLDLFERILGCGYTGPLTCERKEDIQR
ncbi:G2/M phase-specific E3 ubiquitin-protein ligase-like isoform X2 [Danio rerio]|uniref:G2/M phase-specific E3 ubiquitin-protein ligase-like isoform X2 n=1 Tax=Danio rerio TaxID=7955 RepID=A0AC58HC23_DANRE